MYYPLIKNKTIVHAYGNEDICIEAKDSGVTSYIVSRFQTHFDQIFYTVEQCRGSEKQIMTVEKYETAIEIVDNARLNATWGFSSSFNAYHFEGCCPQCGCPHELCEDIYICAYCEQVIVEG